ncbi:MAG: DUF4861 domain-containing protein [bacterium]|nr:DUF4861 domain-containing protein [candidate division KSB1 bacterium]MDH7558648.1 DUF4861 domain-containing protein [bacterium]
MRSLTIALGVALLACVTCARSDLQRLYPKSVGLQVQNPTALPRSDELLTLDIGRIREKAPDFNPMAFMVFCAGREMPSQADDLDGDGQSENITALLDLPASGKRELHLWYAPEGSRERTYAKRTQAELSVKTGGQFVGRKYLGGHFVNVRSLRVPQEHTDHSEFIRYEGPGWESDLVGYRFYLDWRNAIDVFGKKVPKMILQDVGQDGFESYHRMADWGMDILKVGESLGIGSLGIWLDGKAQRVSTTDSVTCEVVLNGPVRSLIRTRYFGWKVGGKSYDLVSELGIAAGSRITTHRVHISGDAPNLCTGIVKDPSAELLRSGSKGDWAFMATYGRQSLAGDSLGLAVLFRTKDLVEYAEDEHSHVVVLRPENGRLGYAFLAAWEGEPSGIKTKAEFVRYLDEMVERLANPVVVTY